MSTPRRRAWVIAAAWLALAACSAPDATLPKDVINALETCFNRNDAAACADLFSDDAEIFPGSGQVVSGRAAIHDFYKDQIAAEFAFDTDSTKQLLREDIAIDQGTYRVRNVMAGRDVEHGNYLQVWRHDGGGWKLYRVMYNPERVARASVSVGEEPTEPSETTTR